MADKQDDTSKPAGKSVQAQHITIPCGSNEAFKLKITIEFENVPAASGAVVMRGTDPGTQVDKTTHPMLGTDPGDQGSKHGSGTLGSDSGALGEKHMTGTLETKIQP